jgi:hypothetical protein
MRYSRVRAVSSALRTLVRWAAVIATAPGLASATVIDFDQLPDGTAVTNQYAEATFSSSLEKAIYVVTFPAIANSHPNIICVGPAAGGFDCTGPIYIDFATPVNNLTFWAIEANAPGVTAVFTICENGSCPHHPNDYLNGRNGPGNTFVDLSAYANVTRLEIGYVGSPETENGIGWDTFSFDPVPEPGTGLLVIAGLLGLTMGRRADRG